MAERSHPHSHDHAAQGHAHEPGEGHRGHPGHAHDGHDHGSHDHDHGPGLHLVHASYGKLLTGFWIIAAFMFVEIAYQYQPLIWKQFTPSTEIRKTAAMYVRDDRDLSQIYNPAPTATVNSCPA